MEKANIIQQVESLKSEMTDTLVRLIRIPAIGPENGGEGEHAKAETLMEILSEVGFDKIERYDADDPRVQSGKRPNIVAYLNGKTDSNRLWIVTHLDVVPPGEESLWKVTKPFVPRVLNGCVYGRGSEDNGQSIISSIFVAKALKQLDIKPNRTLALAFVADEEQGSRRGIQHLINNGLFKSDDLVVVPDSGDPTVNFIEVAEKSILWLKIITFGKQTHACSPEKGLNAHRIGMQVALEIDAKLHQKYNARNNHFKMPYSTFEPTKKDKNVDTVNIVPGEDVCYFDCRVLPQYNVEDVLTDVYKISTEFETKTQARIKVEVLNKQNAASEVNSNSEVVMLLKEALRQTRGPDILVGGIGGGTCAAFFRKGGIPAAVWSIIDEVAHQPDEYAKITNMVETAKVLAMLAVV